MELIERSITGRQFHYYLNPQRSIEEGALEVHGITEEFLQDKPLFADISDEFLDFIRDAELLIDQWHRVVDPVGKYRHTYRGPEF